MAGPDRAVSLGEKIDQIIFSEMIFLSVGRRDDDEFRSVSAGVDKVSQAQYLKVGNQRRSRWKF